MRVVVLGAGAVGSYFGALLARAGHAVTLVGRGEHIGVVAAQGLAVRSVDGDFALTCPAVASPPEGPVCDLLLVAVKSPDTAAAARSARHLVGPETLVLSLQNGVDNEDLLVEVFGAGPVLGGLCYVGARIDRPAEVVHSAAGRIILGELGGGNSPRVEKLAAALSAAGIPTQVSPAIRVDLWTKLLWNLSFNSVSALTRGRVGEMLARPATRAVLVAAAEEAWRVARAAGVPLDDEVPARVIASGAAFADLKTSMLQDVEKGRPLEADALNGVVVRLGRAHAVPTPVNDTLYGCLLLLDATNRADPA